MRRTLGEGAPQRQHFFCREGRVLAQRRDMARRSSVRLGQCFVEAAELPAGALPRPALARAVRVR
jgi:hypothetical protein